MSRKIFVGFDNYTRILGSDAFLSVTWNTFLWTFFSTITSFVLGFCAALALESRVPSGGACCAWHPAGALCGYVPSRQPTSGDGSITAISVQSARCSVAFGITDQPMIFLDNANTVLPSLIVVNVWKEFPFAMIMVLAGLQTVPDQLLRAARVDGAGHWHAFWHVTFPHLRSVSTITVLLLVVTSINSFTIPWIMTGGGPAGASHIWITAIYEMAFGRLRFGPAAAYSVILFVILMSLGYFYVRALAGPGERSQAG